MIEQVMQYIKNHFVTECIDGTFRITGNVLADVDSPWVFIQGSRYHDGVWRVLDGYLTERSVEGLCDEEFTGRVYILEPPQAFIHLCKEIEEYNQKVPLHAPTQESFGAYSYSRPSSATGSQGWQSMFSARLSVYRKMFSDI